MMKNIYLLLILSILAAGCAKSTPAVTDNGNPGQIKIIVFYDQNGNNTLDAGETGQQDRVIVSQGNSCGTDRTNDKFYDTDGQGVVVIKDLKPGEYCVGYAGEKTMSTKLGFDIFLSSDQEVQVSFGTLEP